MKFSANNFLYTVKQLVTGNNRDNNNKSFDGGIKVEKPIFLNDILNTSAYPVITDSTGGTGSATFAAITAPGANATTSLTADMTAVKNALSEIATILNAQNKNNSTINSGKQPAFIVASGTNPAIGVLNIPIPRDYDEASDAFAIKIFASLANADAAITITGTPTIQLIGGSATTGSAANASTPFASGTAGTALTTTEAVYEISFSGLGLKRDAILSITLAVAGTTTGNFTIQALEYIYDSTIVSYNETDSTTNTNSSTGNLLR